MFCHHLFILWLPWSWNKYYSSVYVVLKSNLVVIPAAVSLQNNTRPSCLPDAKQKQSEGLLHTSSHRWPPLILLQHNTVSLPCLSSAPQFSVQIHRPDSGPLQPLCVLPMPISHLRLHNSPGETELPPQVGQSTALPLFHVRPQRGALSGGALPRWARLRRSPQRDECSFIWGWEKPNQTRLKRWYVKYVKTFWRASLLNIQYYWELRFQSLIHEPRITVIH